METVVNEIVHHLDGLVTRGMEEKEIVANLLYKFKHTFQTKRQSKPIQQFNAYYTKSNNSQNFHHKQQKTKANKTPKTQNHNKFGKYFMKQFSIETTSFPYFGKHKS